MWCAHICFYFLDMAYNGTMNYFSTLPDHETPRFDDVEYKCNIDDCRKYGHVKDDIIHKISQRLNRITKMTPIPR